MTAECSHRKCSYDKLIAVLNKVSGRKNDVINKRHRILSASLYNSCIITQRPACSWRVPNRDAVNHLGMDKDSEDNNTV